MHLIFYTSVFTSLTFFILISPSLGSAQGLFQEIASGLGNAGRALYYHSKSIIGGGQQRPLIDPSHHDEAQKSTATRYWLDQQDHNGAGRGYAPFAGSDYPVYRNVKSYSAAGDGSTDDTSALQNAINDAGNGASRYQNEVSTRPALVFVPGGTYKITKKLDMRLNTILVGDPNDRPVFRPSFDFKDETLIDGEDYATHGTYGTTNFFTAIKNIVIDTTILDKDRSTIALRWGIAQACHLTNIKIQMPNDSRGHTGIAMTQGSTIAVTDISIEGGAVGIKNGNQQVLFKNISFKYCTTALAQTGGFSAVLQGARIDTCAIGVDTTGAGQLGSLVILDSTSVNSGPVVKFRDSSHDGGDRNQQIIIENLDFNGHNPIAIGADGSTKLANTNNVETWIWGNVSPGTYQTGKTLTTDRSPGLLSNDKFFTMRQPTYQQYDNDKVVNVKAVNDHP
ncbi:MAG: hypothetical protein Q9186_005245 [Xanthomendoza sp. 1 TL-2023]